MAIPALGATALAHAALQQSPPWASLVAVLAGGAALGASVTGLSLGHWYLVKPTMALRPLVRLSVATIGILVAQAALLPLLLFLATLSGRDPSSLWNDQGLFFAARVLFGIALPLPTTVLIWRTARIRSLDSATGLLYVLATLVLAGEILARSLAALAGIPT